MKLPHFGLNALPSPLRDWVQKLQNWISVNVEGFWGLSNTAGGAILRGNLVRLRPNGVAYEVELANNTADNLDNWVGVADQDMANGTWGRIRTGTIELVRLENNLAPVMGNKLYHSDLAAGVANLDGAQNNVYEIGTVADASIYDGVLGSPTYYPFVYAHIYKCCHVVVQ